MAIQNPVWKDMKKGWRTEGDPSNYDRQESPDLANMLAPEKGSIGVRKGARLVTDQTSTSPAKKVTMLHNYTKSNGTKEVVVAYDGMVKILDMDDGTVSDLPTPITGQDTNSLYCADIQNDILYFCNGVNNMVQYDTTTNTTVTLTNIASTTFRTNVFAFRDRKMFAVDYDNPQLIHRSQTDNVITFNYTIGNVVENAGTSRIMEGGTPIRSIQAYKGMYIFSENGIFTADYKTIGSETLFVVDNFSRNVGAITHKSTVSIGRALVYFDPVDRSMQQLGQKEYYPDVDISGMSDAIRNTTQETLDFTEASSVYWNRYVLTACKSSEDEPANDLVLLHDIETNAIFPIRGWYVSCWMVYEGRLFFGSSNSPTVYEAFTGSADGNVSIDYHYDFNIEDFNEPETYKNALYLYLEGTIDPLVKSNIEIAFDYGQQVITKTIDGSNTDYVIDPNLQGFLGEEELGVNPLGGITQESERTYCVWMKLKNRKFQNAQVKVYKNENGGPGAFTIRRAQFKNLSVDTGQPPSGRIL